MGTEIQNKSSQEGTLRNQFQEKSKKCNWCEFSSSVTSTLRRHFKIHSGEKLYKCNYLRYSNMIGNRIDKAQIRISHPEPTSLPYLAFSKRENQFNVPLYFKLRKIHWHEFIRLKLGVSANNQSLPS